MTPGKIDTKSAIDYLNEADSLFKAREYENARVAYENALESATESKQNSELTEAFSMIARCYLIQDKREDGRTWIEKAGAIARQNEPLGWSRYLSVKGRFQWQDKELDKATQTFKDLYQFCSSHKLYERAIDAAHMVAITGTLETQVEWGLKGIKEAEEGNITGWLGPLWNNLGATYEEQKDYEKSLDAYQKAREYHWRYGDEKNKLVADWAIGHAYLNCRNYDEAGKWFRPVLAWCERIGEVEFRGLTYRELGEIELARNDYKIALDYFTKAEADLKSAGMPDWDAAGYQKIVDRVSELRGK